MKEKIEFLYEHRDDIPQAYLRDWIVRMYQWLQAQIRDGKTLWKQSLGHNSEILITRAHRRLTRRLSRSVISQAELEEIKKSEVFRE